MSDAVAEEYNKINKLLPFPERSNLMTNLMDEIEKNICSHYNCREFYLKDIIRHFVDVVPYIDIDADREWLTGSAYGIQIDNSTSSKSQGVTTALIIDYCKGINITRELSTIENYIISCYLAMHSFSTLLVAKCLSFDINLMDIQNQLKIYLTRNIDTPTLCQLGYGEQLKNQSRLNPSEKTENPLIFDKCLLNRFHSALDGFIWESTDIETFKNWFRVNPVGKPIIKEDMITYFCYAVWQIDDHREREICPNIENWYSALTKKTTTFSKLKAQAVDPKKSEIDRKIKLLGIS